MERAQSSTVISRLGFTCKVIIMTSKIIEYGGTLDVFFPEIFEPAAPFSSASSSFVGLDPLIS
jgi:hypothetical protein